MNDDVFNSVIETMLKQANQKTRREDFPPETIDERKKIRAKIEAIAWELSRIQEQALQNADVRNATREYWQRLRERSAEIDPFIVSSIPDGTPRAVLLQAIAGLAQHDPVVAEAAQKAKRLTFETMIKIDPNSEKLSHEFHELLECYMRY